MLKDEHIKKKFGQRIKTLRVERDWSQAGLSHEADLDPGYIGKVERGEINPGLTYIYAIAKAFNMSLSELMDF